MWSDPGLWIALGVSALFIVVGVVMCALFSWVIPSMMAASATWPSATGVTDRQTPAAATLAKGIPPQ